jgi:nitrite reductase/ring-hydroxylating ferredoxin subunit
MQPSPGEACKSKLLRACHTHVCLLEILAGADACERVQVVDVGGKKVLVAEADGQVRAVASWRAGTPYCALTEASGSAQVYAVSNKCTHLNVSLVGKTAFLQGKVCPCAPIPR